MPVLKKTGIRSGLRGLNVLHQVPGPGVRADLRVIQAERGVVVLPAPGKLPVSFHLAGVEAEGLLRHVKARLPAEGPAALMRWIHRERNSRFFAFLSRYA